MEGSFAYVAALAGPGSIGISLYRDQGSLWPLELAGGKTAPRWRKEIAPSIHQDVDKVEKKLLMRLQRLKALALDLGILWGEVLLDMTLCSAM